MTTEPNLPATMTDSPAEPDGRVLGSRQPISVAFLPLALVTFVILALTIVAWTFLAAT